MHHHVANTAAQPYLSLSIFSKPTASCEASNDGGYQPSVSG